MIKKMKPKRAKKAKVTAPVAAVKRMLANSRTSSMGCVERRSTRTSNPSANTATAKPARVRAVPQPTVGASMIV